VPHERLLQKLEALGAFGNLLKWIHSFLTDHFQRVIINGSFSQWLLVNSGVLQGSVLGPLLFLLYVNDIQEVVKHSTIKLFADNALYYIKILNQWLTVICYSRT